MTQRPSLLGVLGAEVLAGLVAGVLSLIPGAIAGALAVHAFQQSQEQAGDGAFMTFLGGVLVGVIVFLASLLLVQPFFLVRLLRRVAGASITYWRALGVHTAAVGVAVVVYLVLSPVSQGLASPASRLTGVVVAVVVLRRVACPLESPIA